MANPSETSSHNTAIEYQVRTLLPVLGDKNNKEILNFFEKQNIPKNSEKLLDAWSNIIWSKMKYDAMNFALMKEFPLDSEQWWWIDKLDVSNLSMNPEQITLTIKILQEYGKSFEKWSSENISVELLILSLKKWNFKEFISLLIEFPTLQTYLRSNENFAKNWMQIYERKWTSELIQMGIWNCKTLALMTKMMLKAGNIKWNLWITKIQVIEWKDNHLTLKIYTPEWIIDYDPMGTLYRKNPIKG